MHKPSLFAFSAIVLLLCCVPALGGVPSAAIPGVTELSVDNFDAVTKGSQSTAFTFILFYAPWCGHCKNFVSELRVLAEAYEAAEEAVTSRLTIAKLDADNHQNLAEQFGVRSFPTLMLVSNDSEWEPLYFPYKRTASRISKFLSDHIEHLPLLVEGQPEEDAEKSVPTLGYTTELTDKTFSEVALNPSKDVLVFFYAPWCYYCKLLAADYRSLAEIYYNDREHVVIARMDATAEGNEAISSRYNVESFPTIYFFPKGSSKSSIPIVYDGHRRLEDLLLFMNSAVDRPRLLNGDISWEYGVNPHLSSLLQKYVASSDESQPALIQAFNDAVASATGLGVGYYQYLGSQLQNSYDPSTTLLTLEEAAVMEVNALERGAKRDSSQMALNILVSVSNSMA